MAWLAADYERQLRRFSPGQGQENEAPTWEEYVLDDSGSTPYGAIMKTLAIIAVALFSIPAFAEDLHVTVEDRQHVPSNKELRSRVKEAAVAGVSEQYYRAASGASSSQDAAYWKAKYEQAMEVAQGYKELSELLKSRLTALREASLAAEKNESSAP